MPVTINGDGTITGYTPPIADGSITSAKLANGAVGTTQLANNSVTSAKTTGFQRRISTSVTLPTNTDGYVHNVTTGVKKIEIILSEVSATSNSQIHIKLGTGGNAFEGSGYGHAMGFHRTGVSNREATVSNSTGAFESYGLDAASYSIFGKWELNNPQGNTWVSNFDVWGSDAANHQFWGTGYKTLSNTLAQIIFFIESGNFDAGYLTIIETMGDD
tara:strand:- start:1976 stop:2623 length:648 start_codon:yes stop_codon:yes gene_type:complete